MNPGKCEHQCYVENLNLDGCIPQEIHVIILFYLITPLLIMSVLMFFFSILTFFLSKAWTYLLLVKEVSFVGGNRLHNHFYLYHPHLSKVSVKIQRS